MEKTIMTVTPFCFLFYICVQIFIGIKRIIKIFCLVCGPPKNRISSVLVMEIDKLSFILIQSERISL